LAQDKFSSYPGIKELLQRVKDEKEEEKKRLEYYHDPVIGRFSH
jgi:homogentisate 1,2-dioxygenase